MISVKYLENQECQIPLQEGVKSMEHQTHFINVDITKQRIGTPDKHIAAPLRSANTARSR